MLWVNREEVRTNYGNDKFRKIALMTFSLDFYFINGFFILYENYLLID